MLTLCGYGATTAQTARTLKSLFNHSGANPAQLTVPGSGVGSLLSITGDASIRSTAETMNTEQLRVDETERESSQFNQNCGQVRVQDVPVLGTVGETIGDDTRPKDVTGVDVLCNFGSTAATDCEEGTSSVCPRTNLYRFSAAPDLDGYGFRSSRPWILENVCAAHVLVASGDLDELFSFNEEFNNRPLTGNQKLVTAIHSVCDQAPEHPEFTAQEIGGFLRAYLLDIDFHVTQKLQADGVLFLITRLQLLLSDSYTAGAICWEDYQIFLAFIRAWVETYTGFDDITFVYGQV